jgi:collagen type VII alpha
MSNDNTLSSSFIFVKSKTFEMIPGLVIVCVLGIVFVIGILVTMLVILFVNPKDIQQPCPSGGTGGTGSGIPTGCIPFPFIQVCFTGPTGPSNSAIASTGITGPTGVRGARGMDIINNAFGPLTDTLVNSIQSQPNPYRYVVTVDMRSNFFIPAALAGDQSLNMIYWTGTQWVSVAQFTGEPGETGYSGIAGSLGPTGPNGRILPGFTGPQGPTGVTGGTGTSALLQMGSVYGDAQIVYPTNFVEVVTTSLVGDVNLTEDAQYDILVIPVNIRVNTRGYILTCRTKLINNGIISNFGFAGVDAATPSAGNRGGTGGLAGTLGGGGQGVDGTPTYGNTGGSSPQALMDEPYFKGGNVTPADFGGPVLSNTQFNNSNAQNCFTNPVLGAYPLFAQSPPLSNSGAIPISGGSGGGCPFVTADGITKPGSGGGGGVVVMRAPIMEGNGTVDVSGGNSGNNSFGGLPAAGGAGGLIVCQCPFYNASYTFNVSGGLCRDINSVGGIFTPGNGNAGYVWKLGFT